MIDETLRGLGAAVERRLEEIFDDLSASAISPLFATRAASLVLTGVRDLTLRGGKRLRAALLINGAALFDERAASRPAVIDAACALEVLHTYFLIHDDIMDHDEVRRGGPAVHTAFAAETGDEDLGHGLGILAGDLACALVQVLLTRLDVEVVVRDAVTRIFAEMHLDVVHGQALDMLGGVDCLEVARRKTASYTTVGPLAAGAALARVPEERIIRLADIARPLGIAFQLRDDMLGTFGASEATGKPVGSDLKAGKRTYLLEEGLRRADGDQRRAVEAVLGHEEASDAAVERAREALVACGARDACARRVEALVAEFARGIDREEYLPAGRRFLLDVARYIGERER